MSRFSLAAAVPQHLEFEAPDGTIYPVNRVQHLSTMQQQQFLELHRRIQAAHTRLHRAQPGSDAHVQASNQVLQALREFVALIGPAIPEAIRDAMTPEQQTALIEWWVSEHPQLKPAAPTAPQRRPPAHRRTATKRG